ncbi:hypothetical protein [Nannocystis pusilla]|uniref:hypothetical protein n=1 Tax=Nannocystis pusilla TaxID=889268 RepID=UPI003B761BA8
MIIQRVARSLVLLVPFVAFGCGGDDDGDFLETYSHTELLAVEVGSGELTVSQEPVTIDERQVALDPSSTFTFARTAEGATTRTGEPLPVIATLDGALVFGVDGSSQVGPYELKLDVLSPESSCGEGCLGFAGKINGADVTGHLGRDGDRLTLTGFGEDGFDLSRRGSCSRSSQSRRAEGRAGAEAA